MHGVLKSNCLFHILRFFLILHQFENWFIFRSYLIICFFYVFYLPIFRVYCEKHYLLFTTILNIKKTTFYPNRCIHWPYQLIRLYILFIISNCDLPIKPTSFKRNKLNFIIISRFYSYFLAFLQFFQICGVKFFRYFQIIIILNHPKCISLLIFFHQLKVQTINLLNLLNRDFYFSLLVDSLSHVIKRSKIIFDINLHFLGLIPLAVCLKIGTVF